jgi:PAS domain S-box-containing protein
MEQINEMNKHQKKPPKANILVVDDTLINLRVLMDMLTEHGYRVLSASNGPQALSMVLTEIPDMILLDIGMPYMDGYDVCKHLKADERTRDIPVIFISALSEVQEKVKAFSIGGVDYVTKPFKIYEVLARVETHLALRNMQNALQQAHDELERRVEERTAALKKNNEQLQQEITERHRVEAALRESEEKYRRIFETVATSIIMVDKAGKIVDINPYHFIHMAKGQTKKDYIGKTILALPSIVYAGLSEAYKKVLEGETLNKTDVYFPITMGEVDGYFNVKGAPFLSDGEVIGAVFVHEDITERKQAEEKLKQYHLHLEKRVAERTAALNKTNKQLQDEITERKRTVEALKQAKEAADAANRAKSEFLANMSHEIRTPLNAVIGFSELLSELVTDRKQKSYLYSIQMGGETLLTLINDILDLSKIEAGRLEINSEPINPIVIFNELEQIFALKIAEKGLYFIKEIDQTLPPTLVLDETRLRQVLLNLVGNAIKFTDQGYVKLRAQQRAQSDSHRKIDLIISVEDTGIGIPKNQQEKIFEAFQQQDGQSTRKYGGTGLGLAITKRLVKMMNGHVSVHSQEDQGSVFEITLHDVDVSATAVKKDETVVFNSISFEQARVLIVDDIKSNRDLIKEGLSQVNLEVIEAEDGQKGLLFATEYQPDVIIMDLKMPVMSGYEAIKQLRIHPMTQNIPVIALTATVMGEQSKIKAHGFDGFLPKPVNMLDLFGELSRYLKHSTQLAKPVTAVEAETLTSLSPSEMARLPELMDQLIPKWEKLQGALNLEKVKDFADDLRRLGERYRMSYLSHYGENLYELAQDFELGQIRNLLNKFHDLRT